MSAVGRRGLRNSFQVHNTCAYLRFNGASTDCDGSGDMFKWPRGFSLDFSEGMPPLPQTLRSILLNIASVPIQALGHTHRSNKSVSLPSRILVTHPTSRAIVRLTAHIKIRTYSQSSDELWLDEWRSPLCVDLPVTDPTSLLRTLSNHGSQSEAGIADSSP